MKRISLALALATLILLPVPGEAQLFSKDNEENLYVPPPAIPDVPEDQQADWMKYKNPYAGEQTDITNPHRTGDEISAWGSMVVAEAMSFRVGLFEQHIQDIKKLFVREGWQGYTAYLQSTKLLDVIRSGKYAVYTAAEGEPLVLQSGRVDGAWQWQLDVSIITTIAQPDANGEEQAVSSNRAKIRILLTRVAEGAGPDGIAVKQWSVVQEP